MATVKEDIAVMKVHIEEYGEEIEKLRTAKHEHANMLHAHNAVLQGIESSVKELNVTVRKISNILDKVTWMSLGGMAVGTFLIGALIYVLKDIFKVW